MGVKGKLVSKANIKRDGDLFNLFQFPNQFSQIAPRIVQSVDLLSGSWGNYWICHSLDIQSYGKKSASKQRIESIDERKKFEGVPLDAFKVTADVETNGRTTR
ncbi:hypothetical protein OROMI_018614 [Orobanche minor]